MSVEVYLSPVFLDSSSSKLFHPSVFSKIRHILILSLESLIFRKSQNLSVLRHSSLNILSFVVVENYHLLSCPGHFVFHSVQLGALSVSSAECLHFIVTVGFFVCHLH